MLLFSSCSVKKYLAKDQYLLRKSVIVNASSDLKDDLSDLIKLKVRKKLFGFDLPLIGLYMHLDMKKNTWLNRTTKNLFAEKPVFLDSLLIYESAKQMFDFLVNKGYFRPRVEYRIYFKKYRALSYYFIYSGKRMTINEINYCIPDRNIDSLVNLHQNKSLIRKGDFYDSEILTDERERLARILNDEGYFGFNKYYIYFEVDTSFIRENKVNISLFINKPNDTSVHRLYIFNNITFNPYYNIFDTLSKDTSEIDGFKFVGNNYYILPGLILKRLEFRKGEAFSLTKVKESINNFNDLEIYKFIDLDFFEKKENIADTILLDCLIKLTPLERQSYSIEIEANTTEETKNITAEHYRYFGVSGSLSYRNRNLFSRAILWNLRFGGAVDVQTNVFEGEKPVSNYQVEGSAILTFPEAYFLAKNYTDRIFSTSRTLLNLSQFWERNIDYKRSSLNFSYSYSYKNTDFQHFITPVEIGRIRTDILNSKLIALLDSTEDELLKNAYETHLINVFKYGFVYKGQVEKFSANWRIKVNLLETAGNIPRLFFVLRESNVSVSDTTKYNIFGVPFYQYIKTDIDASYSQKLTEKSSLAAHIFAGIGIPFGNSDILPFEKRYFTGGANSLRAWPLRGVGPGVYKNPSGIPFLRTGEIKLEANLEYRFDLIGMLKAAVFLDAGNIWTLKKEDLRPGGEFLFNNFYNQIAAGTGFGLRFDFSYFILRTDFGIPLHDPSFDEGKRWVIKDFKFRDIQFNLGIGYPF